MTVSIKIFLKRRSDITHEEFEERWKKHAALLLHSMKSFTDNIVRYTQFHVSPNNVALLEGAGRTSAPYDGVADIEVEKLEDIYAFLGSQEYAEKIFQDEVTFLDTKSMTLMVGENQVMFQKS